MFFETWTTSTNYGKSDVIRFLMSRTNSRFRILLYTLFVWGLFQPLQSNYGLLIKGPGLSESIIARYSVLQDTAAARVPSQFWISLKRNISLLEEVMFSSVASALMLYIGPWKICFITPRQKRILMCLYYQQVVKYFTLGLNLIFLEHHAFKFAGRSFWFKVIQRESL